MEIKTFAYEATIPKNGLRSLSDGGWRITVDTQELSPEKSAELMQFKGCFGKFVFASPESKITEEDIEISDEVLEYKGEKSKSQRLRAALYVMWQQGRQDKTFEEFYSIQMSKLIEYIKEKLEPRSL